MLHHEDVVSMAGMKVLATLEHGGMN